VSLCRASELYDVTLRREKSLLEPGGCMRKRRKRRNDVYIYIHVF